jgi:hypothetical protein
VDYWSFRVLYEQLVFDRDPATVSAYLGGEALQAARELMRPLERYQCRTAAMSWQGPPEEPVPPEAATADDLWEWYALSRVNDHLLLRFQLEDPDLAQQRIEIVPEYDHIVLKPWQSLQLDEGSRMQFLPLESNRMIRVSPGSDSTVGIPLGGGQTLEVPGRIIGEYVPQLTRDEYMRFFGALGFQPFSQQQFSPFYHEIVVVEELPAGTRDSVPKPCWWRVARREGNCHHRKC